MQLAATKNKLLNSLGYSLGFIYFVKINPVLIMQHRIYFFRRFNSLLYIFYLVVK